MKKVFTLFFVLLLAIPFFTFAQNKHNNYSRTLQSKSSEVYGDLNNDNKVDVIDVSLLIDFILEKDVTLAEGVETDINHDGNTDVIDVSVLIDVVLEKPHENPNKILVNKEHVEFCCQAGFECEQTINVSSDNLYTSVHVEIVGDDSVFTVSPTIVEWEAMRSGTELVVTYQPKMTGIHHAQLVLSSENADTVFVTLEGRAVQTDDPNFQEFTLTVNKEFYDMNGSAVATGSGAYMNTGVVVLSPGCDRVRVCTNTTIFLSAIVWFDTWGEVIGTTVVDEPLSKSTQTFDVAIPYGAVAMVCSTCQSETFRCVAYNSTTWNDDWLSGVLIFGDSITKSANISLDDNQNISVRYLENIPTTSQQLEQANPRYMWANLLRQAMPVVDMRNYAEAGAHWCDFENTLPLQLLSKQIQVAANDTQAGSIFNERVFEPDIIIFALGTNDATFIRKGTSMLGDALSSLEKPREDLNMNVFCDAMRKALEDACNIWPNARIYCVLPLQRADSNNQVLALHDPMVTICETYGVSVIDATYQSGIQPDNIDQMLRDGLHPNTAGQQKLADLIIRCITNGEDR